MDRLLDGGDPAGGQVNFKTQSTHDGQWTARCSHCSTDVRSLNTRVNLAPEHVGRRMGHQNREAVAMSASASNRQLVICVHNGFTAHKICICLILICKLPLDIYWKHAETPLLREQ